MLLIFGKQAANIFLNSTIVSDLQIPKQNESCKFTAPSARKDSTGTNPRKIIIVIDIPILP